jgi:hypothetical protein
MFQDFEELLSRTLAVLSTLTGSVNDAANRLQKIEATAQEVNELMVEAFTEAVSDEPVVEDTLLEDAPVVAAQYANRFALPTYVSSCLEIYLQLTNSFPTCPTMPQSETFSSRHELLGAGRARQMRRPSARPAAIARQRRWHANARG